MRREGDTFYFGQHEGTKFFRAMRLYGLFQGVSDIIEETIEHESEHLRMCHRLGHANEIKGYEFTVRKTSDTGGFSARILFSETIPQEDNLKIALAPENPSNQDINCGLGKDNVQETWDKINKNGNKTTKELKDIILAERGINLELEL